jgi:hypothetical protein
MRIGDLQRSQDLLVSLGHGQRRRIHRKTQLVVEKQGFVDQCVREIRGVRLVHVLHIKLLKIKLQAI